MIDLILKADRDLQLRCIATPLGLSCHWFYYQYMAWDKGY